MADLVWPSELYYPYQLDTDNADIVNLTSCTYDDGTTVHDIINGGTTTFDTANQIGTTAPGGERISATWSTGKPTNVDDNPFALLLTQQEYVTDNTTVQTFTVGTGRDYSDIRSAAAAQKQDLVLNNIALEFTLYGTSASQFPDWRGYTTSAENSILVRGFDDTATHDGDGYYIVCDNGAHIVYRDFTLLATGLNNSYGTKENVYSENMRFITDGLGNDSLGGGFFKNCLYVNCYPAGINTTAVNSVVYFKSGTWYETNNWDILLRNGSTDRTVDIIAYCEFATGSYGGSYQSDATTFITNLPDLLSGNSQNNVDMTGWFTDPTNDDYTLTQTAQTALQGQGWNGSDIASWAYTDAGGGAETKSFTASVAFNVNEMAYQIKYAALSGVKGFNLDKQTKQQKSVDTTASVPFLTDQTSTHSKEFGFTSSHSFDVGTEQSLTKLTNQSGTQSFNFTQSGAFVKSAGVNSKIFFGTKAFGLGLSGALKKVAPMTAEVDQSLDETASATKSGNLSLSLPMNTGHSADIIKVSELSGVKSFSTDQFGVFVKSSKLTSILPLSFDLSGSVLGENVEFYTYSFKVQGIVVDQRFKGVVLDLDEFN